MGRQMMRGIFVAVMIIDVFVKAGGEAVFFQPSPTTGFTVINSSGGGYLVPEDCSTEFGRRADPSYLDVFTRLNIGQDGNVAVKSQSVAGNQTSICRTRDFFIFWLVVADGDGAGDLRDRRRTRSPVRSSCERRKCA